MGMTLAVNSMSTSDPKLTNSAFTLSQFGEQAPSTRPRQQGLVPNSDPSPDSHHLAH
jgi:hypothetical protein